MRTATSRRRPLLAAMLFLAGTAPAHAATYILPPDEALIRQADLIVRGRVSRVESVETASGAIVTQIRVDVDRTLKGTPSASVLVEQPGGRVGDRIEVYPGIGAFAAGEDVLLLLEDTGGAAFRLDGYALGRFKAGVAGDGTEYLRRDGLAEAAVLAGPGRMVTGAAAEPDRDAARFEEYIGRIVRGESPAEDYLVGRSAASLETAPGVPSPEFTFIGSTPAHWPEFAAGGTITYTDNATGDTGCPAGCHAEVGQGITGWNSVPGALVSLAYGGTDAGIGSKCKSDLDNEIQFNDPCGEIADLAGCTGTLALGGFSGLASGGGIGCISRGGIAFGRITRALLLVNNGVGACLSSCDFRDMIAHETGHTIGAGHSNVSTALMAPFIVSGRCGAFQADDIDFAQCAYEGTPSTCTKLPPFVISVTPRLVKGKVRAIVRGKRFTKDTKVEIDAGSGYVQAPRTRFRKRTKIIGLNVGGIWPAGVPVNVRVFRKATDCESNEFAVTR